MDIPTECQALQDGAAAGENRTIRRPTKLRALCMNPEAHRSFLCPEYDACLIDIVRLGWPSWSCASCPLFPRRREIEAERLVHEACSRADTQ